MNMCNDMKLIELIQQHRCLFDYHSTEYNKKGYVDDVWKQVAAAMDCTIQVCKDKWKNIRASYVRSLKRNTRPYHLAPVMEFIKPFIRRADGKRSTHPDTADQTVDDTVESEGFSFQNAEFNDTESSDSGEEAPMVEIKAEPDPIASYSDDDYEPREKVSKIEKKKQSTKNLKVLKDSKVDMGLYDEGKRVNNQDAMRYFLLSLLPEFDAMDDNQTRDFKIKVLTLIDKIKGNPSREH